jgi:hypothetical protein
MPGLSFGVAQWPVSGRLQAIGTSAALRPLTKPEQRALIPAARKYGHSKKAADLIAIIPSDEVIPQRDLMNKTLRHMAKSLIDFLNTQDVET